MALEPRVHIEVNLTHRNPLVSLCDLWQTLNSLGFFSVKSAIHIHPAVDLLVKQGSCGERVYVYHPKTVPPPFESPDAFVALLKQTRLHHFF